MNRLEKQLLNDFQRDFPLHPRPFLALAERLGVSEKTVIASLARLQEEGKISRVGPVFRPQRAGVSTLAALAAPADEISGIAAIINSFAETNHNYEREHYFNLWFVLTAPDQDHLDNVIAQIEHRTGLPLIVLPLLTEYHIDLGFSMVLS